MTTMKVKSKTTNKEYEMRILKAGTASAMPIVHHGDIEKIAKEENVRFTLAHDMNASYPAFEIIASIEELNCSAIGFGSCPPGSGGLGATDPVKAARCDARDNAVLELLDFDWENAVFVDGDNNVTPTETINKAEEVVVTAEIEEPTKVQEAEPIVSSASETASASETSTEEDVGAMPLAFGRYKNAGKTIAELYAAGGEETQWYNYICDTEKPDGTYKYTGKYPDAMRQYRKTQV